MAGSDQILLGAAALALTASSATGCAGGGSPPQMDEIPEQKVGVGERLVLVITATDVDGDGLSYSFSSDVPELDDRATMTARPDGAGVFQWQPQASDVGIWHFDFTVSDGSSQDTETTTIEVQATVGNSAPVFREPLGTGTTLDLGQERCLEVNIVVDDQDSTEVFLGQEEPVIESAVLSQTDGLSGRWSWCPNESQTSGDDRYTLTLSADDQSNPKTLKHYLIVLRKRPPKPECPGTPPVVSHSAQDQSTVRAVQITADISDDRGLKGSPLLYYSLESPGNPPALRDMTQVTMELDDGTMQSGTWSAEVPNPVADQASGSTASIYYVIVADDNDDEAGDCDHVAQAPTSGSYTMKVTNPGGAGGAGVCESCTADVQCGDADDLCVRVGTTSDAFCMRACDGAGDCPADFTCAAGPIDSVEGASGRQCVPRSGNCSDPGGTDACIDDSNEENDSRTQAAEGSAIAPGLHNHLVSCPGPGGSDDDEDWYKIEVAEDSQVDIVMSGGSSSDLDLRLYDSRGDSVAYSGTLSSTETISECLTPGTYYIRVYTWSATTNNYTISYERRAQSCGSTGPTCYDDELEDDDNPSQARYASVYPEPFESTTNAICPGDDDWFEIELYHREKLLVDLTFEQTNAKEDLDLHFHDSGGTDLTPCSVDDVTSCSSANGQSATSNEHYEYSLDDIACDLDPCTFYVVVHGFDESENLYDIRIAVELDES